MRLQNAKKVTTMKTSIMVNALARVGEDVQGLILIAENLTTIIAAMRDQMIEKAKEDPDAKLLFGISIGAMIEPCGADANVKTWWHGYGQRIHA